jgi:acyl-CoA hydrolase
LFITLSGQENPQRCGEAFFLDMLSVAEAMKHLLRDRRGPMRLFVSGCSGEPIGLARAMQEESDLARDITFLGVWIPGVNKTDWAGFHETARAETFFLSAELRGNFEIGKVTFRPLHYSDTFDWLMSSPIDAGVVMVSLPDEDGNVSLGVSPDFAPAVLQRDDVPILAIINPNMPRPVDSLTYPLARFECIAFDDSPLPELHEKPVSDTFDRIGRHIAELIGDAPAALQFGLGNVQQAALKALAAKTRPANLRIHSGMVTDSVLELIAAGHVPDERGRITLGVALGTPNLYEHVAKDRRFTFRPVSETHCGRVLSEISRFVAINSVLEVDLFGQANAEFLSGCQVSAIGGLVDFLRGAAASEGGMPILALPSSASGGQISRIVPRLDDRAVSIARTDVRYVVTEYGAVNLHGLDINARASALISIADPRHRTDLNEAWKSMRESM